MSDERSPDVDRAPDADHPHEADGSPDDGGRTPRPLIERIGLGLIALVMATAFGGVAVAAWLGGEVFLTAMGAIACLMTAWVGGLTVIRG